MSAAPKQWTLKIVSPPAGPLAILRDGEPLPADIRPGRTTPVELFLASIGTCFALSCHAAFASTGRQRVGFELSVTGHKAPQPPNRLETIELEVIFDATLSPAEALSITASAEKLCTVTNTVISEPAFTVNVTKRPR